MNPVRRAVAAAVVVVVATVVPLARPAAASHGEDLLLVTVAINAAGGDQLRVMDDTYRTTGAEYEDLAEDVALTLGVAPGSFRVVDDFDGAYAALDERLVRPDGQGRLSFALDTGRLQLLAQGEDYEAVLVKVCTPRVAQVFDTILAPQAVPFDTPGNRCRGWYQPVDEPPIRAVVQLVPDRQRYPWAVGRVAGAAAIAFGLLGIAATLLRRGPMGRRSWVSWLLSVGVALGVLVVGWGAATLSLWLGGAPADAMLLGRGPVGEQVARTVLPGLAFLLPALLPAALLLTVPRREAGLPPPPMPAPVPTWWPASWWPQWVAQGAPRGVPPHGQAPPVPPAAAPPPAPPPAPPFVAPPPAAEPPDAQSGWARPGSGNG